MNTYGNSKSAKNLYLVFLERPVLNRVQQKINKTFQNFDFDIKIVLQLPAAKRKKISFLKMVYKNYKKKLDDIFIHHYVLFLDKNIIVKTLAENVLSIKHKEAFRTIQRQRVEPAKLDIGEEINSHIFRDKYCLKDWYFYDEAYYEYGPYKTKKLAEQALDKYCKECLG